MEKNMIAAPDGTCNIYDSINPPTQLIKPIAIDKKIIFLKLLVNIFAVICGSVSSEITKTIPTICRQATMVSAMKNISVYSKKCTGIFCESANSRSNAIDTIVLRNSPKNKIKAMARTPNK